MAEVLSKTGYANVRRLNESSSPVDAPGCLDVIVSVGKGESSPYHGWGADL
ncbi:hypothetical protein LEMLEM_LOCUS10575 [Lemmus lemmus]